MRITKKLPSIKNVAAGLTAVLECPVGYTYDRIILAYSGTAVTRSMIKNIQVKVNSKPIWSLKDADELQNINDYYGRADNSGYVSFYFNRPEMTNIIQERVTGLGTLDVQTLSVEFDIDSGAPGDFAATATALWSEPQPLGLITKIKAFPTATLGSGENEIDNIVKGPRVMAMHLFKSDITNVAIDVDNQRVYEAAKGLSEALQKEYGRAPVTASCTHVDFMLEGDNAQALLTDSVQDLRLIPTLGTSGSVRTVVEYLGGLAGI